MKILAMMYVGLLALFVLAGLVVVFIKNPSGLIGILIGIPLVFLLIVALDYLKWR